MKKISLLSFFIIFFNAHSQVSTTDRSPIEFTLLFNQVNEKETEALRSKIDRLNSLSIYMDEVQLKRSLKQSIYTLCLEANQNPIDVQARLKKLNIKKSDPVFLQWISKSITADFSNIEKLKTIKNKRAKEIQLNKYLTSTVMKIESSKSQFLSNLRHRVLEQSISRLNLLKHSEQKSSKSLVEFKNPPPSRQESINKLLESL